jgi:hypothetical protein
VRFTYADGALTPDTWTYDAGDYTGVGWASLEPLGDGLVAASWNKRKLSATADPSGHTLVLDTADGGVVWTATNRLYSRQLHVDPSRGTVVALEQGDPNEGVQYELASYSLTDGTRTALSTRINALPLTMAVGDVTGDAASEYVVSESTLDPNLYLNANTVRALEGATGDLLWSHTVKRDPSVSADGGGAWGLRVVDDTVVASYLDDADGTTAENRGGSHYARIAALAGKDGNVNWERRGIVASQMWTQPFRQKQSWLLRTVDTHENIHVYDLANGREQDILPLVGAVSSGTALRVNGDTSQDLVVGGESRGVFAYDGPSLVAGDPTKLWSATVPGTVHAIVKADVVGDGHDEVVVAADTAAAVIDSRTGQVRTVIDGKGGFVRTVAAADLTGDGKAEVVFATDTVRAYRGGGKLMWQYRAPATAGDVVFSDVSFGDGQVYAQYASRNSLDLSAPAVGGVALRGKTGAVAWSFTPAPGGDLDGNVYGAPVRAGTFASPEIPYADGHAVVYTWYSKMPGSVTLRIAVEIRDGRTGELLHSAVGGGLYTLGNWFTGPEGLISGGSASLRTFAADGQDHTTLTLATTQTAGFATGPGGQRILVAAADSTVTTYDPSVLTAGTNYPPSAASANFIAAREAVIADLNDDGVDEIVSLNFDEYGADRTAEQQGGAYLFGFSAMRQMATITVDPA